MKILPALNPTLWRTCRILAGTTRLALLRRLLQAPRQTVSQLAAAEKLSLPRASQELRRLQSRGFLQAERSGARVIYRPQPDPQVASAAPILQAVHEMFTRFPAAVDEQIVSTATGLSHVRRVKIAQILRQGPARPPDLQRQTSIPAVSLWRHLRELQACGWAVCDGQVWVLAANDSPLAKCLLQLL